MPSFRMLDSATATYSVAQAQANPNATVTTDFWQLGGANLKTIKPRWISFGGTAAAARQQPIWIYRRGSATTGGAPSVLTPNKADSSDGPASATFTYWPSTPPTTMGAPSIQLDSMSFTLVVAGTLQDRVAFNYENFTNKGNVLNNAGEFLSLVFVTVTTVSTDKFDFSVWWTEQ